MVELARPADVLGLPKLDAKNRVKTAGTKVKARTKDTAVNIKHIIAADITKLAEVRAQVSAYLKRPFEIPYEPITPAERRAELHALSHVMKVVHHDYDRQRRSGSTDVPPNGDFRIQDLIRRADDTAEAFRQIGRQQTEISPYVKLAVKLEHERDAAIKQKRKPELVVATEPQGNGKDAVKTSSSSLEKGASRPVLRREAVTAPLKG